MSSEPKNGGNGWIRALEIFTTVSSLVITAVFIPFGVWTVREVQSIRIQQAEFNAWKNQGPRFTSIDAENLRFKILQEVQERIDKKLENIDSKLTDLTRSINEHLIREGARPINKP